MRSEAARRKIGTRDATRTHSAKGEPLDPRRTPTDTVPKSQRPDSDEGSSSTAREYVDTFRDEDAFREESGDDVATRDTLPDAGQTRVRVRRPPHHPPPPPRLRDLA